VLAVFQHKTFCRFSDVAKITLDDLLHTDRNTDGKFRHICRMSQDKTIRVTEKVSDIYDVIVP